MGSLTSPPKAPAPQPVYIPVLEYITAPSPDTPQGDLPGYADEAGDGDDSARKSALAVNLLDRRRGQLGTVLTGFQGILNDSVAAMPRKTLLGE